MVKNFWDSENKNPSLTLSNDFLGNTGGIGAVATNKSFNSGKYYAEFLLEVNSYNGVGICNNLFDTTTFNTGTLTPRDYVLFAEGTRGAIGSVNEFTLGAFEVANKNGDVIGLAVDFNEKTFKIYNNGKYVTERNFSHLAPPYYFMMYQYGNGNTTRALFSEDSMKFKIPQGYAPLEGRLKLILKNPTTNQHYSLADKTLIHLPSSSDKNMILHGLEAGKEIQLDEPFDKIKTVIDNEDGTQTIIDKIVTPFSVYDHISENPQVLIYTESTDDITVSTTTEPFDIYDEFGDEVEVLFYTDDEAATEANLTLEANWSPIDELEGDFEVVTWTDEPQETAHRVLEMTAIPKPQFIKLVNPKRIYGSLESILTSDSSTTYRFDKSTRYLLSNNSKDWYVWDKYSQLFVKADASTHKLIRKNGMTDEDINSITDEQWKTWKGDYINIGIFLEDNPRDTIVSVVENISYEDYLPRDTSTISDANLYILNTTAKIDISFNGNLLKGVLSDDDLTRVQYRVLVNGGHYYPSDGSFTKLGDSPQNIEIAISSKDIKIDDWNTLKVEFQDFFGTTDYWATQFMGTYSGLMFKDVFGQYYSSEIGEVLQNLDFGVIIAGQTTIEHEIIIKNQYAYDVTDVRVWIEAPKDNPFPDGMEAQISKTLSPFINEPILKYDSIMKIGEEKSLYVRLSTTLGATPNAAGSFDIKVRAKKVE